MVRETVRTVLVTVFSHKNLDTLDLSTKLDTLSPSTTESNREGPKGGGSFSYLYIYIYIIIYIISYHIIYIYIHTHTFSPLFIFCALFFEAKVVFPIE